MGFELPAERGRLWHNMMNSEEHYGLLALRPGMAVGDAAGERDGGAVVAPLPGGDAAPWRRMPVHQRGRMAGRDSVTLRLGADAGHVYLSLESAAWAGRPFPWSATRLQIAIDTHDPGRGQAILPTSGVRSGVGFEFLVRIDGADDAQLLVVPDYLPYMPHRLVESGAYFGEHFRRPLHSVPRIDGVFDSVWALTNRPRFTGEGQLIRGNGYTVGRLRRARAADHSLADWWFDEEAGMVQLRLPWGLLNVSDPSDRRVVSESDPEQAAGRRPGAPASRLVGIETAGFHVGVVALRAGPDIAWTIPALDEYGNWPAAHFRLWTWSKWEEPRWYEYLKPSYFSLQRLWAAP